MRLDLFLKLSRLCPRRAVAQKLCDDAVRLGRLSFVAVHAVFPGPVDTDMVRGLDMPKAPAASVARAILDGVEHGDEDILPDPFSASLAEAWRSGEAKALERQFAAMMAES